MTVPLVTGILLGDDHAMVRRGLRLVLDAEPDLRVVAEAGDGVEATKKGLADDVDLAILDVAMPHRTGLQVARELHERRPELRTLMLSMHENEQYFFEAIRAGASGYVLKSAVDRDLVAACRAAMRGEPFLYPGSLRRATTDHLERAAETGAATPDPLSPRESEVVKLIAEGNSTREIAGLLDISQKTVDRHRANVLAKLGLRNRVDITRYAIRRGLTEA